MRPAQKEEGIWGVVCIKQQDLYFLFIFKILPTAECISLSLLVCLPVYLSVCVYLWAPLLSVRLCPLCCHLTPDSLLWAPEKGSIFRGTQAEAGPEGREQQKASCPLFC